MRALITGGGGFVGTWLASHLRDQGDEVVVTDMEVDVADLSAITAVMTRAAPEAVYHLAAMSHVGESWNDPTAVIRVNVLGTACVLAAARQVASVPLTIVVSSAEVYGAVGAQQLPLSEQSQVAPLTPYAASKAAAEQVALQAWRGYGQPLIVVRPFNHVGPGQGPGFAVSALAKRIVDARARGAQEVQVGTLSTRRDFTDVRDVVRAYRGLAQSGEPGGVYNVCSGQDVALSEVLDRLLEMAGVTLTVTTDPELVRPVDVPVLRGDPSLIRSAIGWQPQIPLEVTLGDVLAYWEGQLN